MSLLNELEQLHKESYDETQVRLGRLAQERAKLEKEYLNDRLIKQLFTIYDRVMELEIYVGTGRSVIVPEGVESEYGRNLPSLYQMYVEAAEKHRTKIQNDIRHIDAGFDVFVPEKVELDHHRMKKINFQIKCRAKIMYRSPSATPSAMKSTTPSPTESAAEPRSKPATEPRPHNTGFYMYPRSSLSKTPLRLANSIGIIDAGYRGDLIGAFDVLPDSGAEYGLVELSIARGDRLVQICAPGLIPIVVNVYEESALESRTDSQTQRADGGFGSTGK